MLVAVEVPVPEFVGVTLGVKEEESEGAGDMVDVFEAELGGPIEITGAEVERKISKIIT